jgi:hypothetical protein
MHWSGFIGGLLYGALFGGLLGLGFCARHFYARGFSAGVKAERGARTRETEKQLSRHARERGEATLRASEIRAREAGLLKAGSATIGEIVAAKNGMRTWE